MNHLIMFLIVYIIGIIIYYLIFVENYIMTMRPLFWWYYIILELILIKRKKGNILKNILKKMKMNRSKEWTGSYTIE